MGINIDRGACEDPVGVLTGSHRDETVGASSQSTVGSAAPAVAAVPPAVAYTFECFPHIEFVLVYNKRLFQIIAQTKFRSTAKVSNNIPRFLGWFDPSNMRSLTPKIDPSRESSEGLGYWQAQELPRSKPVSRSTTLRTASPSHQSPNTQYSNFK
jgi:hypothetical protein